MYIFSYSPDFRQNSCGFNFVIKLKKFSTIFKITLLGWFFEKWSPTSPSSRVFLRPNFRVDFFLFRIIFKGISFVKLKVSSIFWWTFVLVRLIFKGILYIKFKAISIFGGNCPQMNFKGISYLKWNYPPKGIEKKIKVIFYIKLKVS